MIGEILQRIGLSKGYRAPKSQTSQAAQGPADTYTPGTFAPPSPYDKPLVASSQLPVRSPSELAGNAGKTAEMAAAAAIAGPAGAALGITLDSLRAMASKTTLEDKSVLMSSLGRVTALQKQSTGIIDLPRGLPTMVIPDIHAQRDYLTHALQHEVNGEKVLDLLKQGKMNLLCLGDGMHSESRGYNRWLAAEQDYLRGNRDSTAMRQEIVESFGTMKMVMDLKEALGEHFVYLRGNHDDIAGGFRKFCDRVGESQLMATWVTDHYGADLFSQWAEFEKSMPLVARGTGFVASHAAPGAALTRDEIESRSERATNVLTWTDNTQWAESGAKREIFQGNMETVQAGAFDHWLVGHRKVQNSNFRGQFDNGLIQINPTDAEGYVVAIIGPDGKFDPKQDTFRV